MGANLDVVKAAAVAVFAVICAVVNVASNVSVSFHNKKTSFLFYFYFFTKAKVLFKKAFYFLKIRFISKISNFVMQRKIRRRKK